jgi:hypothetical protein
MIYAMKTLIPILLIFITITAKAQNAFDWLDFYATGYYSKWETEENQNDSSKVGVKHKYGQMAKWKGEDCWTTIGLTSPVDSLMYGPHYRQDKKYTNRFNYGELSYSTRFRMSLEYNSQEVNQKDSVCLIKVIYSYTEFDADAKEIIKDTVLIKTVIKVEDFNADGSFSYFYFNEDCARWYRYPSKFINDNNEHGSINYIDTNPHNGIQFVVEWLGVGSLYIDYVEVYDNDGWNDYLNDPVETAEKIKKYIRDYLDCNSLDIWSRYKDAASIDAVVPIETIKTLIKEVCSSPGNKISFVKDKDELQSYENR